MSDIFISYANEDKNRVKSLAHALEKKGWSVWWDRRIRVSQSFDEVIHEALKAAKSVVVVWTKTSVKSTWVKNESRNGLRRGILFPVMLLDEVDLPLEFEHVQTAQLMDWQPDQDHPGFDQFVEDLAQVIGDPVIPGVRSASMKQVQEPEPSPTRQAAETDSQSSRPGEVEPDSELLEQKHPSESTGPAPSTQSPPYLSIGLGLLAAGALVYFIISPQGPSPLTRDQASYRPMEELPRAKTDVITPTTAPEPIKQPSVATTQEKPAVKKETTAEATVTTKPRPIASPAKTITGKDGAPMVLVPAGEFMMGSPDGEGDKDQHPRHRVALSAFYMDKYEVTNRRFEQFVHETNHRTTAEQEGKALVLTAAGKWELVSGAHWRKPEGGETVFISNREEHPVVSVSWEDARSYCRWAGKRLPTEAEFEYATRAGTETKYWWGNDNPGSRRVANVGDESAKRQYSNWDHMTGYDDGYVRTAPIGSFEVNPFGLHDMTGNVWEWTADWYDETYYIKSPAHNPKGPASGEYRVFRGGSWLHGPDLVRSADRRRATPWARSDSVGFRCAQDIPK